MARRVAVGWLVLLGVALATGAVAYTLKSRANEHTIKYWTETVDQRIEVCNPKNADLAAGPSASGGLGIIERNSGGNICILRADGNYVRQPYVNRLSGDRRSDPELFKERGWVLKLARIDPETTPAVIDAYQPGDQ